MRHAEPPEAYQDRLDASLTYLESHLDQSFSLSEMAWNACLSPFHFHRVFHKLVGCTPGEHLRRRRLDLAARNLLETDLSIAEIAQRSGYVSMQGFMRAFRGHFHATPSGYRALGVPLFLSPAIVLDLTRKEASSKFSEPVATRSCGRLLVGLSRQGENDSRLNRFLVWQTLSLLGKRAIQHSCVTMDRYVSTPTGEQYQFFAGIEVDSHESVPAGLEILELPERTEALVRYSGSFDELWQGSFNSLWCCLLPGFGMRPEASLWKVAPEVPKDAREPLSLRIPLAA